MNISLTLEQLDTRLRRLEKELPVLPQSRETLPAMIFDIDGVIADNSHRMHFIMTDDKCAGCDHDKADHYHGKGRCSHVDHYDLGKAFKSTTRYCICNRYTSKRDWEAYHSSMDADTPIEATIGIIRALQSSYNVVLVTGRPEKYREATESWLRQHNIPYDDLVMRPNGNFLTNAVFKKEMFYDYVTFNYTSVAGAFEDNPATADMYRQMGLTVFQLPERAG